MFGREGDGGGQPAIGLIQPHGPQRARPERQRPAGVVEEPAVEGELQAPGQLLFPAVIPGEVTRCTDVRQGVDEGLGFPKLLGESDRAIAPQERPLEIVV